MNYTVTPSGNGKHLVCCVHGPITPEIALAFTRELNRMSRRLEIKRFLTDVRDAPNALSALQNYNFAYQAMADLRLQRGVRSAILVDPEDTSHDFVETLTQNAGYNVRLFRDENTAIAWLES